MIRIQKSYQLMRHLITSINSWHITQNFYRVINRAKKILVLLNNKKQNHPKIIKDCCLKESIKEEVWRLALSPGI